MSLAAHTSLVTLSLVTLSLVLVASGCSASIEKPPVKPPERPPFEPGRLEQRFDPARNMTLLRVRPPTPPPPGRSLALVAAGGFRGRRPRGYTDVLLGVRSADARWHLTDCKTVALSAGQRTLGRFGATRQTEIGAGWLGEYILVAVPFTRVYVFVHAASPTLDVCGMHYVVVGAELERLRQLVDALRPPPA